MNRFIEKLEKHATLFSLLMILGTFVLGILYSIYLGEKLHYADEDEYYKLASHLVKKGFYSLNGETPTAWRPPGYPFFLAPLIFFGSNIVILRIVNFFALSLAMLLIYLILKSFSQLAAVLGVFFMICYPVLFYTAGTLYPQTLAMAFSLFAIWLFFKDISISFGKSFSLGLVYGLLILIVPTCICNLVLTAVWFLFRPIPHRIAKILLMICTAALLISSWTLRNYMTFETFITISTNDGINLLIGNSPTAQPNLGVNTDLSAYQDRDFKDEIEENNYYKAKAVEYIKNNKLKSLKLYYLKFLNYFNYRNDLATSFETSHFRSWVLLVTYGFILLVAMFRLFYSDKIPLDQFDWFLVSLYLLNAALISIYFTRIRFRLPYDPLLIMMNARFLATLIQNSYKAVKK